MGVHLPRSPHFAIPLSLEMGRNDAYHDRSAPVLREGHAVEGHCGIVNHDEGRADRMVPVHRRAEEAVLYDYRIERRFGLRERIMIR